MITHGCLYSLRGGVGKFGMVGAIVTVAVFVIPDAVLVVRRSAGPLAGMLAITGKDGRTFGPVSTWSTK